MSDPSKEERNILTPLELLSHMNCEFCQAAFKVCVCFFVVVNAVGKIVLTAGFS